MKILNLFMIILISVAFSFIAQGTTQGKEDIQGKEKGGIPSLKGMIVEHFLINANALDLTDKQKKELSKIRDQYIYPMAQMEAKFKIHRIKIIDLLQDPNFNPDDVKAELKKFEETVLEISNMSIDALVEIRSVVGLENFTYLWSKMNINK